MKKKLYYYGPFNPWGKWHKLFLTMKITAFLLFVGLVNLIAGPTYSQDTKISLNMKDASVESVLNQIEEVSEYYFLFNQKLIDVARKVNIAAENEPIKNILSEIFADDISFIVSDRQIILTPTQGATALEVLLQQQTVTGKITDSATGEAMPGVNIVVKGTSLGTISDASGNYSITVTDPNTVLLFSFIGYISQEVPWERRSNINVSLVSEVQQLEEVVVIGYGTMRKSSITASISKVENKLLEQIPTPAVANALLGRVAGVNISTIRNTPGAEPIIRVRGPGSIDAGNDPLIVIDGFPGGSLSQLNMNDIQSIEVLKDASSSAIYGSRGSGGVIIVTTKRGRTGAPTLSFNTYAGPITAFMFDDWVLDEEWYDYIVKYQNREYAWVGGDTSIPVWGDPRRPASYQVNPVMIENPHIIWQDVATQTGNIQSYNLVINGGTENIKYYVSGTYNGEEGIIPTGWNKSYFVRANVDIKINKIASLDLLINPSYTKRRIANAPIRRISEYPPWVPNYKIDGRWPEAKDYLTIGASGETNPWEKMLDTYNYSRDLHNIGEVNLKLDLLEGLRLKISLGTNILYNSYDNFTTTYGYGKDRILGRAGDSWNINLLNENILTYDKTFNEVHEINALLGASYQKNTQRSSALRTLVNTYNNTIIQTLDNAVIDPTNTYTTMTEWGLISYFARIFYGYKEKYLLSASLRTDGCSRFGPDNKWGYFPSASIAWRISQENFMQSIPVISELKIRGSFGATGNFNIGNFDYLGKITGTNYSPDNILTPGMVQSTFENRNLGWEKTISYDLGLELGLFKNRLNFVFDYYDKRTSDLLYNVTIPALTGFTSSLFNTGEIRNRGVELEINTKNLVGEINWQTSFSFYKNRNEVTDLGGVTERIRQDSRGMAWILRIGEPMFSFYGYRMIGVLQDAEDVASSPVLAGSVPGLPKIEDVNKDNKIDSNDKVILGNFMPKLQMGMTNDFTWKRFDLSIAMQASLGAKVLAFERMRYGGPQFQSIRRSLVENQWWSEQEPGDGKTPAASLGKMTYIVSTDHILEDASFFYIRNLNLGYTLPSTITQKIGISNLRIFTSMNNLMRILAKDHNTYNPEGYTSGEISGVNSRPGYSAEGTEPVTRVITFGANVTF